MQRSARLAVAAGLLLLPPLWGSPTQAETPATVEQAKAGVVWIIAGTDDEVRDGKVASGSGFLMLTRGLVVTNAHVVFDQSGRPRTNLVVFAGGQQRGFGELLGVTPRAAGQLLLTSADLYSLLLSRMFGMLGSGSQPVSLCPAWLPACSSAMVVGYKGEWDIAILVLDLPLGCSATPLGLGNAQALSPGSAVYAVGCPGPDGEYSVAAGRVLAVGTPEPPSLVAGADPTADRQEASPLGQLLVATALLETDLRVAEGFSGSPLLNEQGEVVGILTSRIETQAKAFGGARLLLGWDRPLPAGIQEASRDSLHPALQDRANFGELKWRNEEPEPESQFRRVLSSTWPLTVGTDGTLFTSSASGSIHGLTSPAAPSVLYHGYDILEGDAGAQTLFRSIHDELKAFCGFAGNLWPLYTLLPSPFGTQDVLAPPYHWLVPYQGGLVVAAGRHRVARLLAEKCQWRKDFKGEDFLDRQPLVAGDLLYVSGGKHLLALNAAGKTLWTYAARKDEKLREPVRGPDGAILIAATSSSPATGDRLYAIAAGGKLKWTYGAPPGQTLGRPQLGGSGRIYLLSGGSKEGYRALIVLAADGSVLQTQDAPKEGLFAVFALASDESVWVGDSAGSVDLWRPGTDSLVPCYRAPGFPCERIVARKEDVLCILSTSSKPATDAEPVDRQTTVVSLSLDGQKRGEWTVPDRIPGFHTIADGADGTVALATRRYLYVFSPHRDRPYVCAPDERAYYGPLVGPDGTVYVGTSVSAYAFGPPPQG